MRPVSQKSQHSCGRWAHQPNLSFPCSDFTCSRLKDSGIIKNKGGGTEKRTYNFSVPPEGGQRNGKGGGGREMHKDGAEIHTWGQKHTGQIQTWDRRHTDGQTDRQTDRQTDIASYRGGANLKKILWWPDAAPDGWTDRQTDRQTCWSK